MKQRPSSAESINYDTPVFLFSLNCITISILRIIALDDRQHSNIFPYVCLAACLLTPSIIVTFRPCAFFQQKNIDLIWCWRWHFSLCYLAVVHLRHWKSITSLFLSRSTLHLSLTLSRPLSRA